MVEGMGKKVARRNGLVARLNGTHYLEMKKAAQADTSVVEHQQINRQPDVHLDIPAAGRRLPVKAAEKSVRSVEMTGVLLQTTVLRKYITLLKLIVLAK